MSSVIAKLDKYEGDVSATAKGRKDVVFFSRRKNHELAWHYKLVKYALLAMTILILIFGAAVLISTAYLSTTPVFKLAGMKVAVGLAVIGALILVMAVLGCCGSVAENKFLLLAYIGLMGLLFFIQMIIIGWVFAQKGQLRELIEAGWNSSSNDDRVGLQNQFNCCGLETFNVTAGYPCATGATEPCYTKAQDKINSDWNWMASAAFLIGVFEIFSIVLAVTLKKGIKKAQAENKVNKAVR